MPYGVATDDVREPTRVPYPTLSARKPAAALVPALGTNLIRLCSFTLVVTMVIDADPMPSARHSSVPWRMSDSSGSPSSPTASYMSKLPVPAQYPVSR